MRLPLPIPSNRGAESIVPSSGFTMTLMLFSAAAMAFLAVFVLAVAGGAERAADEWAASLDRTATVRMSAATTSGDATVRTVEEILDQTPGIADTRRLQPEEQKALIAPWFGEDVPLDLVAFPVLIEVTLTEEGPDRDELERRLAAAAPGAIFDDHSAWREPVSDAAGRLRLLTTSSLVLMAAMTAAVVALAASSSFAANAQVIDVLRLVGAEDRYITRLFVRRFALRAAAGAAVGSLLGVLATLAAPEPGGGAGVAGIGFYGTGWLWPLAIPFLAGLIAYLSTRMAAARRLRDKD